MYVISPQCVSSSSKLETGICIFSHACITAGAADAVRAAGDEPTSVSRSKHWTLPMRIRATGLAFCCFPLASALSSPRFRRMLVKHPPLPPPFSLSRACSHSLAHNRPTHGYMRATSFGRSRVLNGVCMWGFQRCTREQHCDGCLVCRRKQAVAPGPHGGGGNCGVYAQ